MSRVNIVMNEDEELDIEVDNIINQIKNQGKSLKSVEKERPELKKEDLEEFIIENASAIVLDSIEMVQSLKLDVVAGGDSRMVEAVSELVKATTAAIDSLSKLKLSDDKLKGQKELKQMDIESKSNDTIASPNGGIFLSQQEVMNHLFGKKQNIIESNDDKIIDL